MADRELQIKITVDDGVATSKVQAFNDKLQANDSITKAVAESEKRLDASFKAADQSADKAAASVARLGQAKQATGIDTAALTAKILQFAGPAVLGMAALSVARLGSDIQDMSQKLGMAASEFDALSQMSKEFGIEAESVVQAMLTLSDRVAGGDKSTVAALGKLKINVDEFRASAPEQMFYTLAEAVRGLSTQQERIAVLSDLGGRSFRQFAGMMSEDLTKLKSEMTVFSDGTAKELNRMAVSWDRAWNAAKRYSGEAIAAMNVGLRAGEAFRESFGPLKLPGPPGKDRTLDPFGRNPNEARDLEMGLSPDQTDRLSARPLDWAGGKPGFLPGASGSTPGDEFSTQLTGRQPNLGPLGAPPLDAAAAWGAYWSEIEQGAATVPPVLDRITTSTQKAAAAFTAMGQQAAIALAVPAGVSMSAAYAEAGVGSGLGGSIGWNDPEMQKMAHASGQRSAFERAKVGGIGGTTVNVNASGAWFENTQMIEQLVRKISDMLAAQYGNARHW